MTDNNDELDRRTFLSGTVRAAGVLGIGSAAVVLAARKGKSGDSVWQIDPDKCVACGNCATYCVLDQSAVKCMHNFPRCGYCRPCFAYFEINVKETSEGAENQLCPTGAIIRKFIEEPYYEYHIDGPLCIGCGKCVKGCHAFGNGSLYLQVAQDRCLNCNECAIAVACPSEAFHRRPADDPYLKNEAGGEE